MDRTMLELYTDYLIASTRLTTATGLSEMIGGQISHDKVTRFLSGEEYSQESCSRWFGSIYRPVRFRNELVRMFPSFLDFQIDGYGHAQNKQDGTDGDNGFIHLSPLYW